jgi:hypothetical protein
MTQEDKDKIVAAARAWAVAEWDLRLSHAHNRVFAGTWARPTEEASKESDRTEEALLNVVAAAMRREMEEKEEILYLFGTPVRVGEPVTKSLVDYLTMLKKAGRI